MSTPQDVKARFLADHRALHPHSKRVRDATFQQGGFFDARDLVQVRYEMLRRHLVERQPVTEIIRDFGVSRQMFYVLLRMFQQEGLAGLLPRKRGPKGAHKCTDEGVGRGCWPEVRCPVAPADPGATAVAAGEKTPPQNEPPAPIIGPSELVARYESLRQTAASGPSFPFYELAVLLHQGVPGWLAFVERRAEGCRTASSRVETQSSFSFQVMTTASVPRRPEVVCVLASVVSHCLGGVA
jgi:hypothetical protein